MKISTFHNVILIYRINYVMNKKSKGENYIFYDTYLKKEETGGKKT